ncbi:NAD kinase [bioreactor metagenome]|uniref:NAD kinase n=1 Tax=bioreactor metagenome TaxID=1076179 RepID=A0A645CWU1_9ZZZZ
MKFKRVKLIGKNLDDIRPKLLDRGLAVVDDNFELVVAHGGDGTLLWAERDFPGVPKLPLRDARTAPLCRVHDYDTVLDDFAAGRLPLSVLPKLEGRTRDRTLTALNDIFVHNLDRVSALRYQVLIDGELYATEIVGDSVGVSTVHGSTAYYRSITHSIFRVGIGLAFSNSTEEINHLVLHEDSVIVVRVLRGPALLVADNSPETIEVPKNGEVTIRRAAGQAQIYGLGSFMCPKCRMLRHPNKHPFQNFLPL